MPLTTTYPLDEDTFNRAVNNFSTTTTATIAASGADTVSLATGNSTLPSYGFITVESEIMYYTAKTPGIGDACDLTVGASGRGIGNTAEVAHASGVLVERRPVAEDLNQLQEVIEALQLQVGLFKDSISLTPTGMGAPAQVDALFTLDNGNNDTNRRTMLIDFQMTRTFTDATPTIYTRGTLNCCRYTDDADNPQIGDLDESSTSWQDGSIVASGVDFSMSDDGADSTTLWYQTSTIANTDTITFQGTVKFKESD